MRSSHGLHSNSTCLAPTAFMGCLRIRILCQSWLVSPRGSDWELAAISMADVRSW
jgi:hypothetical protein